MREQIRVLRDSYIYRVEHRIMEGDCDYDHGPRLVQVPTLLVDKYPVTNAEFYEFLQESGYWPADSSNFLRHWMDGKYLPEDADKPVVWVSHEDALSYAAWYGCRLLYDFEWQYVAAGARKKRYPWGNSFDRSKCNDTGGEALTPVNTYPEGASCFGICDLCGNAHEWTQEVLDDGMHRFTFLRGGCSYKAPHFWHAEGGAKPNDWHLKFPLLNEGMNRCATVTFRCAKEEKE